MDDDNNNKHKTNNKSSKQSFPAKLMKRRRLGLLMRTRAKKAFVEQNKITALFLSFRIALI